MARRGKFGRQPRSAPSLTSTIVAIAREMENKQDSNIMSAWQQGGSVDGKKVTDSMVLAHWKDRMQNLSKDDPEYDAAKNEVQQLNYAVAQSKADLLNKQGKLSDAAYAQFFLNEAKKVPKDSEFYRTLQKDAAQFIQSAATKGRTSVAQGKYNSFVSFQDGVNKSYINGGAKLNDALTQFAYEKGMLTKQEAGGGGLMNFSNAQDDPGRMAGLLGEFNAELKANPGKFKDLLAALKVSNPGWNGVVTTDFFAKTLDQMSKGYTLVADRANKDGYTAVANSAAKGKESVTAIAAETNAWSTAKVYVAAHTAWAKVVNDPTSTDADRKAANDAMAGVADRLSKTPGLDVAMANRLKNDSLVYSGNPAAVPGMGSYMENFTGFDGTTGENAKNLGESTRVNNGLQLLQGNPGQFVHASSRPDPNSPTGTTFDPSGNGPVTVVSMASVNSSPSGTTMIATPTASGGMVMRAVSIGDVVVDNPLDPSTHGSIAGHFVTYNVGEKTFTLYTVPNSGQPPQTTNVNPYLPDAQQTRGADGVIHITPAPPAGYASWGDVQTAQTLAVAAQFDATYHTNLVDRLKAGTLLDGEKIDIPPSIAGGVKTDVSVTFKGGALHGTSSQVSVDGAGKPTGADDISPLSLPQPDGTSFVLDGHLVAPGATDVVDKSRGHAGPQTGVDFPSWLVTSIAATGMSGAAYTQLFKDPNFAMQLQASEAQSAGGDPAKLASIQAADLKVMGTLTSPTTAPNGEPVIGTEPGFNLVPPADRTDLALPGRGKGMGSPSAPAISFGHDLNLPNVPNQLLVPVAPVMGGSGYDPRTRPAAPFDNHGLYTGAFQSPPTPAPVASSWTQHPGSPAASPKVSERISTPSASPSPGSPLGGGVGGNFKPSPGGPTKL